MKTASNGIFWIGLVVMVAVMGAVAYTDTYYSSSYGLTEKSAGKSTACIDVKAGLSCPTGYALCRAAATKCCNDAAYCPK